MTNHPQREAFLANQRWFAGKGRDFEVTEVRVLAALDDRVRIELVEVAYPEGEPARETYQMPVVVYPEPQDRLAHALVREGDGAWTYDAVHDKDAMAVFLAALDAGEDVDGLEVHRLPGHDLDTGTHSTLFGGEQSNSSLAFGDDSLLKFFRRLTPGTNPDIEIHDALTRAGNPHVAALYGYLSSTQEDLQLAILQQFLRTASDGWDLALASARNLFTEGDLHADEVGGDFAAEAYRLGATLASVHATLAEAFGTQPFDGAATARVMQQRLDAATLVVPELAELALAERFTALAEVTGTVQRVHGDLHLGQTLRTSLGWKLVDFEGEPAKDLAERQRPDSPWRDIAGMVRSFDYAASAVARDIGTGGDESVQIAYRAGEWTAHNTHAFLAGYAEERSAAVSPAEEVLLAAYVVDKAVYEVVYEARNRPGWRGIPLTALGRLSEEVR